MDETACPTSTFSMQVASWCKNNNTSAFFFNDAEIRETGWASAKKNFFIYLGT